MVKKIAVLIMLVLITTQLVIAVSAEVTDITIAYPTVPYFTGSMYKYPDGLYQDRAFGRVYKNANMRIRVRNGHIPYLGFLTTNLQTGKLYKWSMQFGEELMTTDGQQVGDIVPTTTCNLQLMTQAAFSGFELDSYYDTQSVYTSIEKPLVFTGYTYSIPDSAYKMFYDNNTKTLTCIMILPDSYFDSFEQLQNHVYILHMFGEGTITDNTTISVDMSIPIYVEGDYTALLKEISSKIENLGTGAVTPEHITESIQQALRDHDIQLEDETGGKLQDLMEQINGIVSPYKDAADEINNAFNGLSDVFASTSTASVFKFPEGRMPNGVVLWQEHNIDIGAAWNLLPAKYRSVVHIVCTFTILYIVIQEAIFVIRFIIIGRKGSVDD